MDRRDVHQDNLTRQLERTRSTYLMMREAGYSKESTVRLKFAYRPADEGRARGLLINLRGRRGYEVDAYEVGDGWMVRGTTNPTKLSAAKLGKWVHWMCDRGYRHDCLFDGWSARVSFS